MSLLLHYLLLTLFSIEINQSRNITKYIDAFTNELNSLFCDGLSVGGEKCNNESYGVQDFINSFKDHFENEIEDTSIVTKQIINRLNNKLNLRASFLKNMSYTIQQSCNKYGYDDYSDIESISEFDELIFSGNTEREANLPSDMEFNPVYGNVISLSSSSYKLPNGIDYDNEHIHKDAQISLLLEDTMIELYDNYCIDSKHNEEYCHMYFGSINGLFRQYPAVESVRNNNGEYSTYDPRFRQWYVSAASGAKDVIILIDRSGSMKDLNRLSIAQQAVISVLKTLGSSSYVSVVAFNDESHLSCFDNELVPATKRNVDELIDFVSGLKADGATNFTTAFDTAFTILEKGAKSCQTSILFLTDGIADDVSAMVQKRNTNDIDAVVFSYTLGAEAKPDVPRKIATLTNGIYTHINDEDKNLITIMSSYYLYYAYGSELNAEDNIIISDPYLDFDSKLPMITMSMPVYFNATYFVGVVGIDIPLTFLSNAIGDIVIGRKSYSFVVNQESEVILHPAISDPLTTLFTNNDEYKAVYIDDIEPQEFNKTLLTTRQSGSIKIEAITKQPAGDVIYNGYVSETANLLYVYSGVGPSSLSIAIVIYTDSDINAPNVKGFGLKTSPNIACDINSTNPSNCLSSFNLYDYLDVMKECNVSWINEADIIDSSTLNGYEYLNGSVSFKYPSWYLQPGAWENSIDAINTKPTCLEIEGLYKLTNRFGRPNTLPFGGFRSEISGQILNSIYTMTSLSQFWKSSYFSSNKTFFSFYFSSYQGLSIKYPAQKYKRTFNALIRPWYQRASTYKNLFVLTTPYHDASTDVLVASGATSINSPNSNYPFGVIGFDYKFNEFIMYYENIMSDICSNQITVCYLIDSSAFLLYYYEIKNDIKNDNIDDISTKFFGTYEPTLMQSLIEKGFLEAETNTNFQHDTIDISYIANDEIYYQHKLDSIPSSFERNSGLYTVNMITGTNLYVIYIDNYQISKPYPNDCPINEDCTSVRPPGCIKETDSDKCKSALIDVCIKPDTISINGIDTSCSLKSEIDNFGICILKTDEESDMCASNFNVNACGKSVNESGLSDMEKIIIGCVIGGVALLCIGGYIIYWFCTRDGEGKQSKWSNKQQYSGVPVGNEIQPIPAHQHSNRFM